MFFESEREEALVRSVAALSETNPFLPDRIKHERALLGESYASVDNVWHLLSYPGRNPNIHAINSLVEGLAEGLRARMIQGERPGRKHFYLYEDLIFYMLYNRYVDHFYEFICGGKGRLVFFKLFLADFQHYLAFAPNLQPLSQTPGHVFALFYQIRRAFHFIFDHLVGSSTPMARLRATIWQSIFTHDMRRYRRTLYQRMGDIATLITGPSGTGKELVAAAIGNSRYIAFDIEKEAFAQDFRGSFYPLNLTALSPTLIESELFGHRRGAFTGALADRQGWLELCPAMGTVFLDEIGEVDTTIQVKLLRVLQNRTFQRLGDARDRHFTGKIIAATNRDLSSEMEEHRFREDFYYRLCADMIVTPSLAEQLQDSPADLAHLLRYITRKIAGEEEAENLAREVLAWIESHLEKNYAWPGNVRELEQCVRNIMIHGSYLPRRKSKSSRDSFSNQLQHCGLTADELLRAYCRLIYEETGSYQETARRLELDRRTVKAKTQE